MGKPRYSRVVLLFGGTWDERSVSTESAEQVFNALRDDDLEVTPLRWDDDGWVILPTEAGPDPTTEGERRHAIEALLRLREQGVGVVFNCLHGGPGEDGTVQGLLDLSGIPFTGAGVHGSALSANKETFRRMAVPLGAQVAPAFVVDRKTWKQRARAVIEDAAVDLGFPVMVKPLTSGSSFGVAKCEDAAEFEEFAEHALRTERRLLVERFIAGREISIPCLGTQPERAPEVLPLVEIEPLTGSGFFDLEAKYQIGKARETVPASLEPDLADHLARQAARIHFDLDLGGFSRTDLILGSDGPILLESQTVPGLTAESLFPKSAAAAGMPMTALCRRLIDYALAVHFQRSTFT